MTSNISDLLEQQGWDCKSTLQRLKTFDFPSHLEFPTFAIELIRLNISTDIFMQVTPKELEQSVEVYISFESKHKTRVDVLLYEIEKVYNEFVNDHT